MILICISLTSNDDVHLFICLLASHVSFSINCLYALLPTLSCSIYLFLLIFFLVFPMLWLQVPYQIDKLLILMKPNI